MSTTSGNTGVGAELSALLAGPCPGIEVTAEHSGRWDRMCVTFRWSGFDGLLPEERYERLVRVIPEDYRQKKLAGFVWLELAPGESIDAFLALPRSEDVADKEADIYAELRRIGFFHALSKCLGSSPKKTCRGDLSGLAKVLGEQSFDGGRIDQAKMLFIRRGAYCDCQALLTVEKQLAEEHGAS